MLHKNVDYLGANGGGQGLVAGRILNGGLNVNNMRPWFEAETGISYVAAYMGGEQNDKSSWGKQQIMTNATLRREEWNRLDEVVLKISETRLQGVQALIDRELTFELGNAMGTTVLEYHDTGDAMEAELTMDAKTRSQGDRINFESVFLPIPIIHVDYEINLRALEASRNLGNPLDTLSAERAARKVSAKLESMLFTSTSFAYGGGTIYSYLNHPNRNQVSLGTIWTGKTGAQIVTQVLAIIQASIDALHFGPWELYIPTAYQTKMESDYDTTTPGTTIRERILKIEGIEKLTVIDTLPADNIVLVQMTSDVVRLVRGLSLQNIEWRTEAGFVTKHKVISIQVPQVRADQDGNSGIVHVA